VKIHDVVLDMFSNVKLVCKHNFRCRAQTESGNVDGNSARQTFSTTEIQHHPPGAGSFVSRMSLLIQLIAFFVATGSALLFTRQVRNYATAKGWVFTPPSDRHVHCNPVPRLGGIAILASFCLVTATLVVLRLAGVAVGISLHQWTGLLGPGLLVFAIGLYDDFHGVRPWLKFLVQAAGGAWLYLAGYGIRQVTILFGHSLGPALSFTLTIFWILLVTNAFNLIDGVDGLAAGSALFSTLVVCVIALIGHNTFIAACTIALAGATLGFLRFNFHPATIFLGDCGSLFIGFLLGALALASSQKSSTMIAVAVPVVACGLPLVETALSVLRRFLNGKPLFGADREHIHHKLLARGLSQREVVGILYGISAGISVLSLLLLRSSGAGVVVLIILASVGCIALRRIGYHEVSELQRVAHRTFEQKGIIANNLSIRRAAETLESCDRFEDICDALKHALEDNDFDGFELEYLVGSPMAEDSLWNHDNLHYTWSKPGVGSALENAWSLSLQLRSSTGTKLGALTFYRMYRRSPLQVDVNLFTSSFQWALAGALERVGESNAAVLVPNTHSAAAAAAS
jgi:UDP-GlcNAc:undecaprenyl-phosphate GlcNAc-1-phosphate transferase